VKQHSGWIEVTSQINVETTFNIFLPRTSAAKTVECINTEQANIGGNETILLVEDEAAVRQLARTILLLHGYRVREASSGTEALSVWEQHADEIDLLLTDVIMPEGMTGRELAQKLKLERPKLNVVYTSGYDPDKIGMEAELGDEVSFLPKPYSPQKLLLAVRQSLDFEVNPSNPI
jgi:CheY-like chemotaxis protein